MSYKNIFVEFQEQSCLHGKITYKKMRKDDYPKMNWSY